MSRSTSAPSRPQGGPSPHTAASTDRTVRWRACLHHVEPRSTSVMGDRARAVSACTVPPPPPPGFMSACSLLIALEAARGWVCSPVHTSAWCNGRVSELGAGEWSLAGWERCSSASLPESGARSPASPGQGQRGEGKATPAALHSSPLPTWINPACRSI